MLTTIQEYMRPAYEDGERISSGKGLYKKLKDTIETHVREGMIRNLVTGTKDDLKKLKLCPLIIKLNKNP